MVGTVAHGAEEKTYQDFFEEYQRLWHSFDQSVVNLYSDDARIIGKRKLENGLEQTLEYSGIKFKESVVDTMGIVKRRGDISQFSEIKIELDEGSAKISAKRYSVIKCFFDNNYYMVVERQASGNFLIIEESAESIVVSQCKDRSENDVVLVLEAAAKAIAKQFPVMIDSETRLDSAVVEGNKFIYVYTLINLVAGEVDARAMSNTVGLPLIEQTCKSPNLKPILQQNAVFAHRFLGKDKVQILQVDVNHQTCLRAGF